MKPTRISARNYRSYREFDLDVPTGAAAVLGQNGAGKSSILNVIDLAVYAGGRELSRAVTRGGANPLELRLDFEHEDHAYSIIRTYDPAGRGKATVDVTRDGQPLTRETARETQALIEHIIGIPRRTFRASAFLAQGDSGAFTEADPRERKQILAEVLDLGIYEQLEAAARAELRTVDRTLTETEAQLDVLRPLAADAEALASAVAAAQETLDEEKAIAEQAGARVNIYRAEYADLAARAQTATSEEDEQRAARAVQLADRQVEQLEAELAKAAEWRLEYAGLEGADLRLARARDAHTAANQHEALRGDLTRLRTRQAQAVARASEASEREARLRSRLEDAKGETCPTCGQPYTTDEAAAQATKELAAEHEDALAAASIAGDELVELDQAVKDLTDRISQLPEEPAELPDLEDAAARAERHGRLEVLLSQIPSRQEDMTIAVERASEARDRLAAIHARPKGPTREQVDAASRKVSVATEEVALALRTAEAAAVALERARGEASRAAEAAERVAAIESDTATARDRRETLSELTAAYGRDGIPTMILETAALPAIQHEANRILAELGTHFTVTLRTERQLKSGGTADTLDVVVETPTGEGLYEDFSGGEKTRLNLALRIALARLLANRRGKRCEILCVDEPEFLDEDGTARLAEVLRTLRSDFETVLLVSHQPGLKDSFERTITVTRSGEHSTIAA